jgi:hypothetical protein
MPWVGLEPTISVFERAKTVHALDRAATVIGRRGISIWKLSRQKKSTAEIGRGIVQAISGRIFTAVARDQFQVSSCGICGEQSGIMAGFSERLRFSFLLLSFIQGW